MKRILLLMTMVLVAVSVAGAVPLCVYPLIIPIGGSYSGPCALNGQLIFANASATSAGTVASPDVLLTGVTFVDGTLFLNFNPQLGPGPQDTQLQFQVYTGGGFIDFVDLNNAGTGDTNIGERVCDSSGISGGSCVGTELANLIAGSGQSVVVFLNSPSSSLWIWKDVRVGTSVGNNSTFGDMTLFSQSFHVPEPVTFLLMGSGLLALGLLRRRARKS